MTACTSCFVIRPLEPVPVIVSRSRSCSAASLRTSGDSTREGEDEGVVAGGLPDAVGGGPLSRGWLLSVPCGGLLSGAPPPAAADPAPSPESISASSVPTATV